MAKLSKRQKKIAEMVKADHLYGASEAFELLKDLPKVGFTESVDVSVNLGVDPRKSDQVVRGSTVLPNGTGKLYVLLCLRRVIMLKLQRRQVLTWWVLMIWQKM